MSNLIISWTSKLSQNKRLSDKVYSFHVCRKCKEEAGQISRRWLIWLGLLLFSLIVISGSFLFSAEIEKNGKEFFRRAFKNKQVNYIIAVDNSWRSAKYLDQARGQVDRIMKEIPDDDFPVTLITLNATGSPVKGKANIAAFLQGMKPATIATDFKLLFAAIRKNIIEEGKNSVFLISNGKYDPAGSIYLEGLELQDSQAQSLVLAEEIRDKVRLPDNCELKSFSIGNNPDEIILQAIAGINTKQGY